jgi:UDP-N-acetyl-D-mannosaminuronic acid dehydrogenase
MSKKICVVGLGYIGLPTAVMFASHGFKVHGVDVNEEVVQRLNNKQLHIEEPGLLDRLVQAIDEGLFEASTSPVEADVYMIAVPSPITKDKKANLDYVQSATKAIVPFIKKGNLIILESTVPPRTVEDVMMPILEETKLTFGEELFIAHSPERVIPGRLFEELVNNDRIVGGINERSSQMTVDLYRTFVKGTIHTTDATTAEFVKVIENTYRDINIAFANELAMISDEIGVNVWEAISLANHHPRVNIHLPGPGVGGHCIAVDPWFVAEQTPDLARMITLARQTNDNMPAYTALQVAKIMNAKGIQHPKIAIFGLAFKGNIDDMRESPALDVIKEIEELHFSYSVYDPHIKGNNVSNQTQHIEEALQHADMILILTDHHAFKGLNPSNYKSLLRTPVLFDTKRCMNREIWQEAGFETYLLGDAKPVSKENLI